MWLWKFCVKSIQHQADDTVVEAPPQLDQSISANIQTMVAQNLRLEGYNTQWFIRSVTPLRDLERGEAVELVAHHALMTLTNLPEEDFEMWSDGLRENMVVFYVNQDVSGLKLVGEINGLGQATLGTVSLPTNKKGMPMFQILPISKKQKEQMSEEDAMTERQRHFDDPNMSRRVSKGKEIERQIMEELRKRGFDLAPATKDQDLSGIDVWWTREKDGKLEKIPVQEKFRNSGPDLAIVLYRDFFKQLRHVDYDASVQYYFHLAPDGKTLRIIPAKVVKDMLKEMVDVASQNNWEALTADLREGEQGRPFSIQLSNGIRAQLKLNWVSRGYEQRYKLFAFIPVEDLPVEEIYTFDDPLIIRTKQKARMAETKKTIKVSGLRWLKNFLTK